MSYFNNKYARNSAARSASYFFARAKEIFAGNWRRRSLSEIGSFVGIMAAAAAYDGPVGTSNLATGYISIRLALESVRELAKLFKASVEGSEKLSLRKFAIYWASSLTVGVAGRDLSNKLQDMLERPVIVAWYDTGLKAAREISPTKDRVKACIDFTHTIPHGWRNEPAVACADLEMRESSNPCFTAYSVFSIESPTIHYSSEINYRAYCPASLGKRPRGYEDALRF